MLTYAPDSPHNPEVAAEQTDGNDKPNGGPQETPNDLVEPVNNAEQRGDLEEGEDE